VLHLGDCYLNNSFPVVDSVNGGSVGGLVASLDIALGMLDGDTRVIPGHGAVSNRNDLHEWREMVATINDRVRSAAASGKSLEQIKAERPAREWEGRFTRSFVTSDHPIEEAYEEASSRARAR
jgi:hypothetical protein